MQFDMLSMVSLLDAFERLRYALLFHEFHAAATGTVETGANTQSQLYSRER